MTDNSKASFRDGIEKAPFGAKEKSRGERLLWGIE